MVLGMYKNPFKHFPRIEGIEVARRKICGFDNQKSHFSEVFAVFSGTGNFEPFYLGNESTF